MSRLTKLLDRPKGLTLRMLDDHDDVSSWADSMLSGVAWSPTGSKEPIESSFDGYVSGAYKTNGIIFACIQARAMPFSEARFQLQHLESGRPTDLFDDPSLRLLDNPMGPNTTTGELLWRMEQDVSLAGNSFFALRKGRLRRLRPDWVTIVSGVAGDEDASSWDLDAEVLGYIYEPNGVGGSPEPWFLTPAEVMHYSVIPDPLAQWRGMSWLTPILREIQADSEATKHKLKFFENGAQPGLVIRYDSTKSPDDVARYKAAFDQGYRGTSNAYKVLHLGGGADTSITGMDFKQLEFRATQGAGETRIAAAAGVGAIIARFSEGMAGSALNQGNYQAAIRQFGDLTLRPLWRTAAASLAKFVNVPPNARLWYDVRDVAMLHDSASDEAEVLAKQAQSLRALLDAGWPADAAVRAVDGGDISLLTGAHSGMFSVQLQPPSAGGEAPLSEIDKANTIGIYVQAGFTAGSAVEAVRTGDLSHLVHTGLVPITVTSPEA